MITRKTSLPEHVIQFVRYLRERHYSIGINEETDLLRSLSSKTPTSFDNNRALYKAILVKNRKQYILFDQLFNSYWDEISRAEDSKNKELLEKKKVPKKEAPKAPSLQLLKKWLYNGRIEEEQEVAAFSAFEAIGKKDFSAFKTDEQRELQEILKIIAKRLINKKSRRFIKSKKTKHIALRKTIQEAMKKGLSIEQFYYKEKQIRKVNLLLICDVSKSMELYSKFLIEFMYNFQQVVHEIRPFAFSTRLIPMKRLLDESEIEEALTNISEEVKHWSGGTRIGESLIQLKERYGARVVNKDTIVIILSDGWDTGELEPLETAMKYLHRKSEQVIWLNPLASNPEYKPETGGMKVAMPYVDVFASAHNLDSLRAVVRKIRV